MSPSASRSHGAPQHVDGEDRLRLAGDASLDVARIEVERVVDLGEHRCCTGVHDGRHRSHEGEAGHDHLVARADAESRQQDPDRARAGVDRDGVIDADQFGDALLERQHLGTERRIVVRPVSTEVAAAQTRG